MAQAPRRRSAHLRISRLSLRPRAFHARHGTRVRFRLSAPARVKLKAGSRSVLVSGSRSANTVRFSGRGLRPGSYRLLLTARGSSASAPFTILR